MKLKQTIDAVASGIESIADLPKLKVPTFKYYRPISLAGPTGQLVPALAVAPAKTDTALETTDGGCQFTDRLLITWYAGVISENRVASADQALAAETLDHTALITQKLVSWHAGIPGLDFQNEPTLGDVYFGAISGGIWAVEINLAVGRWEM